MTDREFNIRFFAIMIPVLLIAAMLSTRISIPDRDDQFLAGIQSDMGVSCTLTRGEINHIACPDVVNLYYSWDANGNMVFHPQ